MKKHSTYTCLDAFYNREKTEWHYPKYQNNEKRGVACYAGFIDMNSALFFSVIWCNPLHILINGAMLILTKKIISWFVSAFAFH